MKYIYLKLAGLEELFQMEQNMIWVFWISAGQHQPVCSQQQAQ